MKKRILSLIMAVCLVTTCMLSMGISASALAEGDTAIYLSYETCKIGDTAEIKVYSNMVEDYACLVFSPQFDHSVLELQSVECNIEDGTFLYNENATEPKFIWYSPVNYTTTSGEELFVLTFKVLETATVNTHEITLDFDASNICDENGELVEMEVGQGSVTTFLYICGDVDSDLSITGADVVMLSRYLIGLETEIGEGADVNKDGKIDGRDLVKLSRHIVDIELIENIYNQPAF